MDSLVASTARKAGFRSLNAEVEMDPGIGTDAVTGIGGSLILLWLLSPLVLVLLLTAALAATQKALVVA